MRDIQLHLVIFIWFTVPAWAAPSLCLAPPELAKCENPSTIPQIAALQRVLAQSRSYDPNKGRSLSTRLKGGSGADVMKETSTAGFHSQSREKADGTLAFSMEINNSLPPIDGFGASLTQACTANLMKLPKKERSQLLQKLFNKESGMGLSLVRVPAAASDYSLGSYTYADKPGDLNSLSIERDRDSVEILKEIQAINPEVRFMLSPWTAPAWMKTTGWLNGGSLRVEHHSTYSRYLIKTIQAFKKEGIDFDFLTIQNEPMLMWDQWKFPQMGLSLEHQRELISKHVSPMLKKQKLPAKIYALDHNWELAHDVRRAFIDDRKIRRHIGGVAYHCYSDGFAKMQDTIRSGLPNLQTECSGMLPNDQMDAFDWWMSHQSVGALEMGTSGSLGWNLCLDENGGPMNGGCPNCRGMVTIDQTGSKRPGENVTMNGELYALTQVSRFVRPGALRLKSQYEGDAKIKQSAFLNPDGSIALAFYNSSDEDRTIEVVNEACESRRLNLPARGATTLFYPKKSKQST